MGDDAVVARSAVRALARGRAAVAAARAGRLRSRPLRRQRVARRGAVHHEPGGAARRTLEFFLTERYCLYHVDHFGRPSRLEIHHAPWQLQRARAEISQNTMTDALGIPLDGPPLLHFAKRQDVVTWWTRRVRT